MGTVWPTARHILDTEFAGRTLVWALPTTDGGGAMGRRWEEQLYPALWGLLWWWPGCLIRVQVSRALPVRPQGCVNFPPTPPLPPCPRARTHPLPSAGNAVPSVVSQPVSEPPRTGARTPGSASQLCHSGALLCQLNNGPQRPSQSPDPVPVTLDGNRDSAGVVKARILRWERKR